jgi:hypothetical protein
METHPIMKFPLGLALAALLLAGCSSGPSRVKPPSISPSGAASKAMTEFDKDGDGFIAGSELDAAPAIKAAMSTIDTDKDGKVTADEIAARIEAWQTTRIGVMTAGCNFTLDGKPLTGAQVTLEPAPFLADSLKAAVGETDIAGTAIVSVPKEERPTKDTPAGFQIGLYRVRVSKKVNGQETIPAKYNTETTLGQQIAPDDPAVASQKIRFALTTK